MNDEVVWIRIKKPIHRNKKRTVSSASFPQSKTLPPKPFRCPSQRHHRFFLIIHFHKCHAVQPNQFLFLKTPNQHRMLCYVIRTNKHPNTTSLPTSLLIYTPTGNSHPNVNYHTLHFQLNAKKKI